MNTGARRATYSNGRYTKEEVVNLTSPRRTSYSKVGFTKEDVVAIIGKEVRLRTDLGRLRAGTKGSVVDFHETSNGRYQAVIRWNSSNGSGPLHNILGRSMYYHFIAED